MKFDFCIGNPPYQEELEGTSDKPVYNFFIDAANEVAEKTELITPARFLFNAGKTPKEWNLKMLQDKHFKVLEFNPDANNVFPNVTFTGGIAISYRDNTKVFGAIEVFSKFKELQSILEKVKKKNNISLPDIMVLQNRFDLEALYEDFPDCKEKISSDGRERRIVSSAFQKLSVFHEDKQDNDIVVWGIVNTNSRGVRYINRKYIEENENFKYYKVLVPKANGSGAIGEVVPTVLIGEPFVVQRFVGYTQSFIGIGKFDNIIEANACLKYVKSKFARCMLGVLKITQDNPPDRWRYVPLQDFTDKSDIDWSKSIKEIDRQLYKKYGLTEEEINFIELHVKEMA